MKLFHIAEVITAIGVLVFAQVREGNQRNAVGQKPTLQNVQGEVELPTEGVAVLIATQEDGVHGVISLRQQQEELHISGTVAGLSPGMHGFHIHEFGDLRDRAGKAAGGHFNPAGKKHGSLQDTERHAGDLGNINANQDGIAKVNITAPGLPLHFVVGRSIVVHESEDDFESQPSGDAGARLAVGVIGIANPEVQ